jgi:hypothetical protein
MTLSNFNLGLDLNNIRESANNTVNLELKDKNQ